MSTKTPTPEESARMLEARDELYRAADLCDERFRAVATDSTWGETAPKAGVPSANRAMLSGAAFDYARAHGFAPVDERSEAAFDAMIVKVQNAEAELARVREQLKPGRASIHARINTLETALREILDTTGGDYVREDVYDAVTITREVADAALAGTYVRTKSERITAPATSDAVCACGLPWLHEGAHADDEPPHYDEQAQRIETLEAALRELVNAVTSDNFAWEGSETVSRARALLD